MISSQCRVAVRLLGLTYWACSEVPLLLKPSRWKAACSRGLLRTVSACITVFLTLLRP